MLLKVVSLAHLRTDGPRLAAPSCDSVNPKLAAHVVFVVAETLNPKP